MKKLETKEELLFFTNFNNFTIKTNKIKIKGKPYQHMERNKKPYLNTKMQNLFLCRKEIDKLRQKVLGLIQQPCEGFQWAKKQQIAINKKQTIKSKSKSRYKNNQNEGIQNQCVNIMKPKPKNKTDKKQSACRNYWNQQLLKQKQSHSLKSTPRKGKIQSPASKKFEKDLKIIVSESRNAYFDNQNKSLSKNTKIENKFLTPSNNHYLIQATKYNSKGKKYRSINTQSTAEYTSQKTLNTPKSILFTPKTKKVVPEVHQMVQSFLLSQKNSSYQIQYDSKSKDSVNDSKELQDSIIKISEFSSFEKDQSQEIYQKQIQEDSLIISSLNSKYWKQEPKKIEEQKNTFSQNQNLKYQSQQNYQMPEDEFSRISLNYGNLKTKHQPATYETLKDNSAQKQHYSLNAKKSCQFQLDQSKQQQKNMTFQLIKNICEKTENFMNRQIQPFRQILRKTQSLEQNRNLTEKEGKIQSRDSTMKRFPVQKAKVKLWINGN